MDDKNNHTCSTCKYTDKNSWEKPCFNCINRLEFIDNWIPKEVVEKENDYER